MRALLATSLGVLSTATLLLPPTAAAAVHGVTRAPDGTPRNESSARGERRLPGRTQSLPLSSAAPVGAAGSPHRSTRAGSGPDAASTGTAPRPHGQAGLGQRTVRPFSLVGVVWQDADDRLEAEVQVRTRSTEDGTWSSWRTLETHPEHAPSPAPHSAEGSGEAPRRGSTAPLWVGRSDGVQVRFPAGGGELPEGLRLELVDPGTTPGATARAEGSAAAAAGARTGADTRTPGTRTPGTRTVHQPGGPRDAGARLPSDGDSGAESLVALPELTREETVDLAERQGFAPERAEADGEPHVGPRPGIVIRHGWGADPDWREGGFSYGDDVRMAFVHHTAGSNGYSCEEAPKVIRAIYRYHVKSLGWRDIGYNFLIDRCGTIYEGRAGGVTEPVRGAHTLGFNDSSMGVAVLGAFGTKEPSTKASEAIAKLTAWKLGLYGVNAEGTTRMTSGGGRYPAGTKVRLHTVSGHRDGFATECPGSKLYDRLPEIRELAARLQGR